MMAMEARGWLALHRSPCGALRSCGRIDADWCRARDDRCDFPQVDMLSLTATSVYLATVPQSP